MVLRRGCRAQHHRDVQYSPGQWVYVWRRGIGSRPGRWTGPGAVALQRGHSVWVGVRGRLWLCSSEQLRP
eukprot:8699249-Alexandrium_andersonii.AAC.1